MCKDHYFKAAEPCFCYNLLKLTNLLRSEQTKQTFHVKMQHSCFKLTYFQLKPYLSNLFEIAIVPVYCSGVYEAEDIYRSLGCDITEQKSFSAEIEQAMEDIT